TLIARMISVALVLILMVGINRVFKLTGEATGAGQVMGEGVRNSRAAQSVFSHDIAAMSGDAPCILLRSQRVSAFRNRADAVSARDWGGNPTEANIRHVDLHSNNIEGEAAAPGDELPPAI